MWIIKLPTLGLVFVVTCIVSLESMYSYLNLMALKIL